MGLLLEARLALQADDLPGARAGAEGAERGARRHSWSGLQSHALSLLADVEARDGQPGRASLLARRALRLYEADGDRLGQGACLMTLANADWERGQLPQAIESFRRALALFREEGEVLRQANCLLALGSACLLYTSPSPRDLSTSRMPSSA